MAYPLSEDHEMIREAARGFLQGWFDGGKGPEKIYKSGKAFDAAAWQGFAGELGMAGVAIDEEFGGADLGDLGRAVVMEELGASLCALPFLTTCGIAVDILSRAGEPAAQKKYLRAIGAGKLKIAYCDGHAAIKKAVSHVAYGDIADVIILSRAVEDGLDYFAVPANARGLKITPEMTMDPTRSFARIDWSNVAQSDLEVIGYGSTARHDKMITQSFIALAAECVGGAQACLDMTLEYTAQRVQFGRPIASFQAVKHRCADMFILIEAARSAVYAAAIAPANEKTEAALIAKAYAADAFFKVAGDAIQLHGGIGFTWEYPLHFFFKRARASRAMFGSSQSVYEKLAARVLEEAA
jgi:alkylation response protein AidB-like acyl-CoA dehydrogenase